MEQAVLVIFVKECIRDFSSLFLKLQFLRNLHDALIIKTQATFLS